MSAQMQQQSEKEQQNAISWTSASIRREIFPYLASTLGHDWKMFIYALPDDGAFDAYNCITYAEMNDNSAKNTILNAIEEWAKQCPNSINMEALEAALVKCGRNDIADKIRAKTPSNC